MIHVLLFKVLSIQWKKGYKLSLDLFIIMNKLAIHGIMMILDLFVSQDWYCEKVFSQKMQSNL